MDIRVDDKAVCRFGRFLLDPVRRRLTLEGEPVKLSQTQFDTLKYLAENPLRVVEKDELLSAVWHGRVVEESNLTQVVFLLRRALRAGDGEGYIVTAPGRGYRFSIHVDRAGAPLAADTGRSSLLPSALKGVRQPRKRKLICAGVCVTFAAIVLAMLARSEGGFDPPPHSVAVLAFTNMSSDPKQTYFSDGLSEELINALARTNAIQVAARMSAFTFKDSNATVVQIARQLNVGAVLEGSVRREGTQLRVTAQLIDGTTGYQLWSHSYNRDTSDVLVLEAEIASAVAGSLEVTLLADQTAQLATGGTRNSVAFDAYLRGAGQMRFFAEGAYREAISAFTEAVRLDPNYANALAGRADALALIAVGWTHPDQEVALLAQARLEADKAVALAPNSAQAHNALGIVLMWQTDLRGANVEFALAHALGPNEILIERAYAKFESQIGHAAEAEAAARHIIELDPLTSGGYYRQGIVLVHSRKYHDALEAFRRETALGAADPNRSRPFMAAAHLGLGDWDSALKDCDGCRVAECFAYTAIAAGRLGHTATAQAAFSGLQASAYGITLNILSADVYAQWGERDKAIDRLKATQAVDYKVSRDSAMSIRVDALLDPVRDTAEFRSLERHLRFPP